MASFKGSHNLTSTNTTVSLQSGLIAPLTFGSSTPTSRPGILKQTMSSHQMGSPSSNPIVDPRTVSNLHSTTSFSQGTAKTPPNNPDPSTVFNSNCQQCVAERVAATVGINSNCKSMECLEEHHLDLTVGGIDFTSLHSEESMDLMSSGEETKIQIQEIPHSKDWCRETSRQLAKCLGACLVAASYAALGGVLFMAVENSKGLLDPDSESETFDRPVVNVMAILLDMPPEVQANVDRARRETVSNLWQVTEKMNILYPENWTRIAAEELLRFQDQLSNALTQEFRARIRTQASQVPQSRPATSDMHMMGVQEWTFTRGLFYAISILTAVGCGVDWVVSPLSRFITVFYILLGAPIMFMYITTIGSLLSTIFRFGLERVTCSSRSPILGHGHCSPIAKQKDIKDVENKKIGSRRTLASSRSSWSSLTEVKAENASSFGGSSGSKRCTWQTRSSVAAAALTSQRRPSKNASQYRQTIATSNKGQIAIGTMTEWDELHPSICCPIVCSLLVVVLYVVCGAAFVSDSQGWGFDDALYFCFFTLTTVGFGGLRPAEPHFLSCSLYLFFGAAVLSTSLHIIYKDVIVKLARYRALKDQQKHDLQHKDDNQSSRSPDLAAKSS